jgi:GDPmannose 4,6-dehydratase
MKALITGVTGQDGYYLSKLLLDKGYEVHGLIRRSSTFNTSRIESLMSKYDETGKFNLHYSDLLDSSSLSNLVASIEPDEIYNLAAQSHVAVSFKNPVYTSHTGLGSLTLLEAVKNSKKEIKFYQASSSEMYGGASGEILDEKSILDPKSPYAASKVFAHNISKIYRESYGLFCVNGILFNHESPLRGETFVTRKISRAAGRIEAGVQSKLTLGNLEAFRDWGFAGDYVEGMWLMMQHKEPDDWVLATGETHSVKEFVIKAFDFINKDWEEYVTVSDKFYRPNEVNHLLGNPSKAKKYLNWQPNVSFEGLVEMMVKHDIGLAKQENLLIKEGLISPTWENPS